VVESDSSVLEISPRVLAFVALSIAVGTWFAAAPRIDAIGLWPTVVVVSAGVLPGTFLLVYVALPLSRVRWSVLVLFALALGLLAFGYSEAGWALAANFAKLWAEVFAGWAFLYLFYEVSLVVLIAMIIPIVDAVSVFTPGAPTHEIVKSHISIYNDVAVVFVGPHGGAASLGPPDILFYAVFLGAAARFNLRPGWTWLATTGLYAASFPIEIATHQDGLPALPFLSLGFLAANADLLWRAIRRRA
jgi:hypothetical protein